MNTDFEALNEIIYRQPDRVVGQLTRHFYANHPCGHSIKRVAANFTDAIDQATDERLGSWVKAKLKKDKDPSCFHYTFWIFARIEPPIYSAKNLGELKTDIKACLAAQREEWGETPDAELSDLWDSLRQAVPKVRDEKLNRFHQAQRDAKRFALQLYIEERRQAAAKKSKRSKALDAETESLLEE